MTTDAFGTAALRGAVLEAWRASPARLREDANTEEDHARGYYRDRVLVELAQNAADAATRAGVAGRLLLRLATTDDGTVVLVAANTGAPLDAAGVASLASLRASAKRDAGGGTVGRFGVGFAAVRAVSDEVTVCSTTGAVRFSLADTRVALEQTAALEAAQGRGTLADEVRRRDGSLPALRLPWPTEGRPPSGYDTAVLLELRDEVVHDEVRTLLEGVDDVLLLALPGLVEVVVDVEGDAPRRLADVHARWDVLTTEGEVPLALVVDRPVEERAARSWRVTWALPRDGAASTASVPHVVHAPTPTDEPCTLPALLVATLPLDPSRRHVAPGPLADEVLTRAGHAYADLVARAAAAGRDATALVPTGLAAGAVDAALRERAVEALVRTPLLVPASPQDGLVPPLRATTVRDLPDGPAVTALATVVAGLVRVPPSGTAALRVLGVEERTLAEVVDELPTGGDVDWPALYDALEGAAQDATAREGLAALPVPLVDGRVVRGPRGVVLLDDDVADLAPATLEALRVWGLRVADPAVARPLLARLGARPVDAAALLAHPALRAAVLGQADDDDLEHAAAVTAAVLDVVAAAGAVPGDAAAWLGLLTLDAADGEPSPAHGLVLPGGAAARLLDDRVLAPVAVAATERWGRDVLAAVGVRDDLVVTTVPDVVAGVVPDVEGDDAAALAAASLDGWAQYVEELADVIGVGAYCGDVPAVADLDAVDEARWPELLAHLAGTRDLRAALVAPVRGEGAAASGPSYTAWWLRSRADLALPAVFALPGASGLPAALVPPVPDVLAGLDATVLRALGGVGSLAEVPAARWPDVLERLGPVGTAVPLHVAAAVWRAWAAGSGPDEPPATVVALTAPGVAHVVADAVVADDPRWWQCAGADGVAVVPVPVPADAPSRAQDVAAVVADLLDLPPASSRLDAGVVGDAEPEDVPDALLALLPDVPPVWWRHTDLEVAGRQVGWWVVGEGADAQVHAVHVEGLAAGLTWATGRWGARGAVEAVLTYPDDGEAALGLVLG